MPKWTKSNNHRPHGPLTRYVKLRDAHAPGMPGTLSPPPRVSDPDMHHGTCVAHVPWCMSGSRTSGFLWNRWQAKRSRHSRRMRNPQFCVSGKRPILRYQTPGFICGPRSFIYFMCKSAESKIENFHPRANHPNFVTKSTLRYSLQQRMNDNLICKFQYFENNYFVAILVAIVIIRYML